ncbi:FliH/SctL family protein [Proteinivorax tanatarense]|uniref:FliH/SctL family protein n=1 Tax=Proteinivorax tanatarense TaxID=1260629 RepID=A0AAU7VQ35_9FIRM
MSNVIKSFNVKENSIKKVKILDIASNTNEEKKINTKEDEKTESSNERGLEQAKHEAELIIKTALKEKEEIIEKAKSDGFKSGFEKGTIEGKKQGLSEGQREAKKLIEKSTNLLKQAEDYKNQMLDQTEKDVLVLTSYIIEKVVGEATSKDKDLVIYLYNKLSPLVKQRNPKEVIVSPSNKEILSDYLEEKGETNLKVTIDDQMQNDEIKVLTDQGFIPYHISSLVSEIKKQLVK